MASLWDYLLGARQASEPGTAAAAPTAAALNETLQRQQGFSQHMTALASRTALSPEDVVAEAVRFADRHREAFHDFIYKGQPIRAQTAGGDPSTRRIVAMLLLLGFLISLIAILGTR